MVVVTGRVAPNELRIFLPLPSPDLKANTYKHWRTVSKAKRLYRELAWIAALSEIRAQNWQTPTERVVIDIDYFTKGSRAARGYCPRDEQNAIYALKSAIDGLVDAGVMADDDHKHLTHGYTRIDNTSGPGVVLTIRKENR